MIRGNVKPGGFAIHHEDIFLRRFVFPTHFARSLKVGLAGFHTNDLPILRVALQEGSLQANSIPVPLFESAYNLRNNRLTGTITRPCSLLGPDKRGMRKHEGDTRPELEAELGPELKPGLEPELEKDPQANKYNKGSTTTQTAKITPWP